MDSEADSADGIPIAYDTSGAGEPTVVMVHGWSCDRTYWRNQQRLTERFRIVTLDLAGHGQSGDERRSWTMSAYGDDVVAVIEELALVDPVLVGHSMGGNACLEAARRLGGAVRGLIWIDTYGTLDVSPEKPSVAEVIAPFQNDFVTTTRAFVAEMFVDGEDPAVASRVVEDMSSAPERVALASIDASLTYGRDARRLVGRLACPIVAINSDYLGANVDSLTSYGVEVLRIPGSGHFPMLTHTERFNHLLTETVDRLAA